MKQILILLLMLAAIPGQAADGTPADADSARQQSAASSTPAQAGASGQNTDSGSSQDKDKQPKQAGEEEEPDCD